MSPQIHDPSWDDSCYSPQVCTNNPRRTQCYVVSEIHGRVTCNINGYWFGVFVLMQLQVFDLLANALTMDWLLTSCMIYLSAVICHKSCCNQSFPCFLFWRKPFILGLSTRKNVFFMRIRDDVHLSSLNKLSYITWLNVLETKFQMRTFQWRLYW